MTLAASGLPTGVTAAFSPNPTTGTSTLTLTASASATTGTKTVTITGTSGSLVATTTLALTVNATSSPNFTISASPASLSVKRGGKGTSTIKITSQDSFSSATTLSATGLPSGVTAAFSSNPVTPPANGSATSTLTLTASATATLGKVTVTVKGTSGSLSHSATIALTVTSNAAAQTAVYNSTLKAPECATASSSCDSGASLLLGRDHMSGGAEPNQPNTIKSSCADGTSGAFHSDESNDRLVITSTSGGALTHGTTAKVTATVWAYGHLHVGRPRPLLHGQRQQPVVDFDQDDRSHEGRSAELVRDVHASNRKPAGRAGAIPLSGERIGVHHRAVQRSRRPDFCRAIARNKTLSQNT